jgi:hypothetical protein
VVALLAGLLVLAAPCVGMSVAAADSPQFADWTDITGTTTATGTLLGASISLSGSHVFPTPISVLDGSWPFFDGPDFTPPLAKTDLIQIGGLPGDSYTLQFGAPVKNPVLEIGSLADKMAFPAGTQITKLSGQSTFTVADNVVTGTLNPALGPDGVNDSNGAVQLTGTFTSIPFTVDPTYVLGSEDGILVQVGASPGPPPPPTVTSVQPVSPPVAGRPVILHALLSGPVQKLLWTVGGRALVGLAGETFLRFRPPPGPTAITVRAVSPSGRIGPALSQTIIGPALVKGGLAARIQSTLGRTPGVFATGPSTLIGHGVLTQVECALYPTTVTSGALQIRGCLRPVQSLDDIPAADRGIIENLARRLQITTDAQAIDTAISLTDAYQSRGPVQINGVTLTPQNGAAIVIYPQANSIASSDASLSVGGLTTGTIKLGSPQSFVISTRPDFGGVNLGTFARLAGGLDSIGAFRFAGDVSVNLVGGGAVITASLQLPDFLKLGGVDFQGHVTLRANNDQGLVVDNTTIGPLNAELGGLSVQQFKISYNRAGNEWRGQGRACVLGGTCLDMIPPNGSVVIRNGQLSFAGASLGFSPPGIPLFPGVSLERIGFGVGLNPTRFTGNARIDALQIYAIDGRLVLAFPTAGQAYFLDRNEVGGGFPASFYGRPYYTPTIGITADAFLSVPVIGDVKLGNGYFLYNYPDYLAFGGGTSQSFGGVISMEGSLDGAFKASTGQFRLGGHVRGCIIGVICRGATGVISSHGVGACLEVGPVNIGGGVVYRPFEIKVWLLDGCKWSRFDEISLRASDASATRVVRIAPGSPSRMIQLTGSTGAPQVKVTGPGGQALQSSATSGFVNKGAIRILRSDQLKLTAVGLQNPHPGVYRIEPLPGSSSIKSFGEASDPPDAQVTASVQGTGARRTLVYHIRRRPDQRVTFSEVGGGSTATIGTVNGGGRGQLLFSPAPGTGVRHVIAQFELAGLPAESLTVARFSPPSPNLASPRGLVLRRRGNTLQVRWSGVPGATAYDIVVTPTDGVVQMEQSRTLDTTIRPIARFSSGVVSVRAVASLRNGGATVAHFSAIARRPTSFGPLAHCRGTAKLVCR